MATLFACVAFISTRASATEPLRWVTVSGTAALASNNTGYLLASNSNTVISLPTSPSVGAVVRLTGVGAGRWIVTANKGQSIQANAAGNFGPSLLGSGGTIFSIASSFDGNKLVACSGGGFGGLVYTSGDGGATWQSSLGLADSWVSVASSADGSIFLANPRIGGGLCESTNSGATWSTPPLGFPVVGGPVACSADGSKIAQVYGGYSSPVPVNGNYPTRVNASGGSSPVANWTCLASSSSGASLIAGAGTPPGIGIVIVGGTAGTSGTASGGQIYVSPDYGATWNAHGPNQNWTSVATSADGTKLAAVATNSPIYISSDSGATWTTRGINSNWTSVSSSADGTRLAAISGVVYTSSDSGLTWNSSGIEGNVVCCSPDGSTLIVGNGNQISLQPFPNADGKSGTTFTTITGPQLSSAELIFVGNGRWQLLSHEGPLSFQ